MAPVETDIWAQAVMSWRARHVGAVRRWQCGGAVIGAPVAHRCPLSGACKPICLATTLNKLAAVVCMLEGRTSRVCVRS